MIGFLRPYLAVIKDSFREAFSSRVLRIMLVLVTVFLLALAPFSLRREMTWRVESPNLYDLGDINDVQQLCLRLLYDAAQDKPSPAKHIFGLLEAEAKELDERKPHPEGPFRERVAKVARGEITLGGALIVCTELAEGLNTQLEKAEFYDRESWREVSIGEEAEKLLDKDADRLTKNELARRNRLLLEAALPNLIRVSQPTSVRMRYLAWDMSSPVPITPEGLEKGIPENLSWLTNWVIGPLALLVAILVTSQIVPQMLEAGSVELLLSKPISRSLLFLSKFAGGCAFIFVIMGYLIVGLWLILGFRMEIWNYRLLWIFPIFLLLFAVYYSISALVGIIWRSAIVSVILTMLVWLAFFSLSLTRFAMDSLVVSSNRIVRIVKAGEVLVTVDQAGRAKLWDPETTKWYQIFQRMPDENAAPEPILLPPRVRLGPLYDAQNNRLIAVGSTTGGGGGFGYGASLWVATPARQFRREEGPPVPPGSNALMYEPSGDLITVAPRGAYRLVTEPDEDPRRDSTVDIDSPIPLGEPFAFVGPDPVRALLPPSAVALNCTTGDLYLLTRGELTVSRVGADGVYRQRAQKKLDDGDRPSVMASAGNTLIIAHDDGTVNVLDATNLDSIEKLTPEGPDPVRFIAAGPSGTWFAMVFHTGRLYLYDAKERKLVRRSIAGQGDISAAAFVDDRTLLVADQATRVTSYDIVDNERIERWSPELDWYWFCYRYGVQPLHAISPKPVEMNHTFLYLLRGQKTSGGSMDLQAAREKLSPWGPVLSSVLFMMVMLAISCVCLWRTDL